MYLEDSSRYKQMVLRLRWLTIIVTSYLVLFGQGFTSPQFLPSSLIVFYLLSNLIACFIPASSFRKLPFFYIVLLFDTFMVSLGIYITSQFETDFYLVYFLILIFASIGRSFKLSMINALVICGIYGWLLWNKGLNTNALQEGILLRIPFILIMNLFYGFLIHSFNERTKRIKMELKEVEESEERYRQIVERTHDSVAILDEKNHIRFFNQRFLHLTLYPPEELNNMELTKIMNGFVGEESIKNLLQDLNSGEPIIHEADVFQKNGGKRKVEVSAGQLSLPTGRTHTIIYLKDITERHQMEERLIQSEKLRALGELASGVAHDFNNALAGILGNTQLLLLDAKEEKLTNTLKTIERVTKDASQIVRRVQDFARKKPQEELSQVDINTAIKDTVEITKPKWKDEAQGKGISIGMVLNLGEILPVDGVASELREVITNMIFNAVEAMPEGGKIEIRTFVKEGKVCIQIRDRGIGMPEETQKKVFEPFFTTKAFSNTGLGLSVSYGIIKRFGGEIEVESQVGQGTTFTITLPGGLTEKKQVTVLPVIKEGRKGRILVIDDEEPVRSVLFRILSQAKHQVTVAGNGEEGIRLFKENKFDVVLTDLGMPGMSGWEVCKAIKRIKPEFPVGMITGWGAEVDQAKIEENGLDFVVSKPFDINHILSVVTERMESKQQNQYGTEVRGSGNTPFYSVAPSK
jgi:PAS domain S-box-containing protein